MAGLRITRKFIYNSVIQSAVAVLVTALALLVFARLLKGGTASLRAFHLTAFLVGLLRPWWAISGVAFLGPLSLLEPGRTHRLVQTEAFVLGAILGHLRSLRSPVSPSAEAIPGRSGSLPWGFWPCLSGAVVLGLLASALPACYLTLFTQDFRGERSWAGWALERGVYGYATELPWAFRSAYNWITGILLAWVTARHATPERVKSLLLFGAAGTVVACLVGLGDFVNLWTLELWRAPNPDLARMGSHRLTSLAGHGGWLAEWILLTAPGLLLLWGGGRRRKVTTVAAFGVVLLSLILTLARIAWLGAAIAAGVALLILWKEGRLSRRVPGLALGAGAVALILAFLINGTELLERLRTLLHFQDRWNYYISTRHLLAIRPLGIGLGLHSILYESLFTPFHRFWQYDHATAHSTWLQILVEQGPIQLLLVAVGALGLLSAVWRGQRKAEGLNRSVLFVLGLAWTGILVDSLAQYLAYVRVTEVMTWILTGAILGLTGSVLGADGTPPEGIRHPRGPRLLHSRTLGSQAGKAVLAVGILSASLVAGFHLRHAGSEPPPRWVAYDPNENALSLWTEKVWRFPLDSTWRGVEFSVMAKGIPQEVVIRVPRNPTLRMRLEPGARHKAVFAVPPRKTPNPFEALRWMEVKCSGTWIPAEVEAGSRDYRHLGVYISGLRPLVGEGDPKTPEAPPAPASSP